MVATHSQRRYNGYGEDQAHAAPDPAPEQEGDGDGYGVEADTAADQLGGDEVERKDMDGGQAGGDQDKLPMVFHLARPRRNAGSQAMTAPM